MINSMILKDFATLPFLTFDKNDFKYRAAIDKTKFITSLGIECKRKESTNSFPNNTFLLKFYNAFSTDIVTKEILYNLLVSAGINPSNLLIAGPVIVIDKYESYVDFETFWHSKIINIYFNDGVIVLEGDMYKMIFDQIFS